MGTIREKLTYLNQTKNLIRSAIIDKGVQVASTDTFRSYAEKIGLIETGGSGSGGAMDLGPYMEPTLDPNVVNKHTSLPTIDSVEPTEPQWTYPSEWYDLNDIMEHDVEDYPQKMLVMYPNTNPTITLSGAAFYRVSDGTTYTEAGTHTWDKTYDRVPPGSEYGYRWVMYYFNTTTPSTTPLTQSKDAIAVIIKGAKWPVSSSFFRNRYNDNDDYMYPGANASFNYLKYVKLMDSDWSNCYNVNEFFCACWQLEYAEVDFCNNLSWKQPTYLLRRMFAYCNKLQQVKMKMPPLASVITQMFYNCYSLRYLHLDFSEFDDGATKRNYYNYDTSAVGMLAYCSALQDVVLELNPNSDTGSYHPWVAIKTDVPIKVSSIDYRNAAEYQGSTDNYWNYSRATSFEVQCSSDGKNWTTVATENHTRQAGKSGTIPLNMETAYQYWRFRAKDFYSYTDNSYTRFSMGWFKFHAKFEKTTVDENEVETTEWADWVQPQFTSNEQDNCTIWASSCLDLQYHNDRYSNNSYNDGWKAFNTSSIAENNGNGSWISEPCQNSAYGSERKHNSLVFNGASYQHWNRNTWYQQGVSSFNRLFVKGADSCTQLQLGHVGARYIIFDTCESMTTAQYMFNTTSWSNRSPLLGVIMPNCGNIDNWTYAFWGTSMTVAPPLVLGSNLTNVYNVFPSTVSDISFVDVSNANTVRGLFRGTGITQINMTFPKARDIGCVCEYCNSLEKADIKAPMMTRMDYAFQMNGRSGMSNYYVTNSYSQMDRSNSLRYVKISGGYNNPENAEYEVSWRSPGYGSGNNGNISISGLGVYSNDYKYYLFDNSSWCRTDTSSNLYQNGCSGLKGTGTIMINFDKPTRLEHINIYQGYYSTGSNHTWTCRCWADAEKTIPLTEEFTLNMNEFMTYHQIPTLDTETYYDKFVFEVISNSVPRTYAYLSDISFDGYRIEDGYFRNMNYAFTNAEIDRIDIDSSKVTDMQYTFYNCYHLADIPDISYASAVNMNYCFYGCDELTELNNTSFPECANATYMFAYCRHLAQADTMSMPKLKNADYMFYYCTALACMIKPDWESLNSMAYMFQYCTSLKEVDLSDTENYGSMNQAFYDCYNLAKVKFNKDAKITNMHHTFYDCRQLRSVAMGDTSTCTTFYDTFYNCHTLVSITNPINLSAANGEDYSFYSTFENCYQLENVQFTGNCPCKFFHRTFYNCHKLNSIELGDFANVWSSQEVFYNCYSLVSARIGYLGSYNNSNYRTYNLFYNCTSLKEVEFTGLGTSRLYYMHDLFTNCTALETVTNFSIANAYEAYNMFDNCQSLTTVTPDIVYPTNRQCNVSLFFRNCKSLTTVPFVIPEKFTNIGSFRAFLQGTAVNNIDFLNSMDLSNFDNPNTDLGYFYYGCTNITSAHVDGLILGRHAGAWSSVTVDRMFGGNPNLTSLVFDFKDVNHSGSKDGIVDGCSNLETFRFEGTGSRSNCHGLYYNTPFRTITVDLAEWTAGSAVGYLFSNCANLEEATINFRGGSYSMLTGSNSDGNTNNTHYMFANCPKLRKINIVNANNVHCYNSTFRNMTNTAECVVDWNNTTIPYNTSTGYMFASPSSAGLRHINVNLQEDMPSWRAFNPDYPTGTRAEADQSEAQVTLNLPTDVQVKSITFTQCSGGINSDTTEYVYANKARFYTDEQCTTPMTAEITLNPVASESQTTAVADVVTDSITCKYSHENGRYMGVGNIDFTAKVKSILHDVNVTNRTYGDYWGTFTAGSTWQGSPSYVSTTTWNVNNYSYGWYPSTNNTWLDWRFKGGQTVKVTGIKIRGGYNYSGFGGQFYTDSTCTVPIGNSFYINNTFQEITVSGIPGAGITTQGLYLKKTSGSSNSGITVISWTGITQEQEYLPWSTPYEEWTEEWTEPLEIPTLVSNTTWGTLKGTTEVTGHEAYRVTSSTGWESSEGDTNPSLSWTFPYTLALTSLHVNSPDLLKARFYNLAPGAATSSPYASATIDSQNDTFTLSGGTYHWGTNTASSVKLPVTNQATVDKTRAVVMDVKYGSGDDWAESRVYSAPVPSAAATSNTSLNYIPILGHLDAQGHFSPKFWFNDSVGAIEVISETGMTYDPTNHEGTYTVTSTQVAEVSDTTECDMITIQLKSRSDGEPGYRFQVTKCLNGTQVWYNTYTVDGTTYDTLIADINAVVIPVPFTDIPVNSAAEYGQAIYYTPNPTRTVENLDPWIGTPCSAVLEQDPSTTLSGFTSNSYLTFPCSLNAYMWDSPRITITSVMKIRTGSTVNSDSVILTQYRAGGYDCGYPETEYLGYCGVSAGIDTTDGFWMNFCMNYDQETGMQTTAKIPAVNAANIAPGTLYWGKWEVVVEFNQNTGVVSTNTVTSYYSSDGTHWTQNYTGALPSYDVSNPPDLSFQEGIVAVGGCPLDSSNLQNRVFNGTIYLDSSYIDINTNGTLVHWFGPNNTFSVVGSSAHVSYASGFDVDFSELQDGYLRSNGIRLVPVERIDQKTIGSQELKYISSAVLSNCSGGSGATITLPASYSQGSISSFDIRVGFTYHAENTNPRIFQNYNCNMDNGIYVELGSENIHLTISDNSTYSPHIIPFTFTENQRYLCRWTYDGTNITSMYWDNTQNDWVTADSSAPTFTPYIPSTSVSVGYRAIDNVAICSCKSDIYLEDLYYEVNGDVLWQLGNGNYTKTGVTSTITVTESSTLPANPIEDRIIVYNYDSSFKTFAIGGTALRSELRSNLHDFAFEAGTSYSWTTIDYGDGIGGHQYSVSGTKAVPAMYSPDNTSYPYYHSYMYSGHRAKPVHMHPFIGTIAQSRYVFNVSTTTNPDNTLQKLYDADFYATTLKHANYLNMWYSSYSTSENWWTYNGDYYSSSYRYPRVEVIRNCRNIVNSINISIFDRLTHDSLVDLIAALVPCNGLSAKTLTIGATNKAKLSAEEIAVATAKNWNIA